MNRSLIQAIEDRTDGDDDGGEGCVFGSDLAGEGCGASIHFYELLGFVVTGMLRTEAGVPFWANLSCHRGNVEERTTENESAAVMVSLGEDPHAPIDGSMQAASLYLFTKDLQGLRADLVRNGVEVSEIVVREYMPKGEMELRDPDGWKVFVGGV